MEPGLPEDRNPTTEMKIMPHSNRSRGRHQAPVKVVTIYVRTLSVSVWDEKSTAQRRPVRFATRQSGARVSEIIAERPSTLRRLADPRANTEVPTAALKKVTAAIRA